MCAPHRETIFLLFGSASAHRRIKLVFNPKDIYISQTRYITDQEHLESFEMWCWRRMEKISWTDHVRNEEIVLRVKEQRNILYEISKRKANWIDHILRRNCLLQQDIAGKIKGG